MKDTLNWNWCRRCAVLSGVWCLALALALALALMLGCEASPESDVVAWQPEIPASKPAPESLQATDGAQHEFYRGYLQDVLTGDSNGAAQAYRSVLAAAAEEPELVAYAALRLARWAEARQERDLANELALRASVLGASYPYIASEVEQLRRRLAVSTRSSGNSRIRGPKAGASLRGVPKAVAAQFSAAEMLLIAYYKVRIKTRIETLSTSVDSKRAAMQRAVGAYQAVVGSGVPEAVVAAEYRIGSTYRDYTLSLSFELSDELDPLVANRLRTSLQIEIRRVQGWANQAYRRSLASATGHSGLGFKEWTEAAKRGLGSSGD